MHVKIEVVANDVQVIFHLSDWDYDTQTHINKSTIQAEFEIASADGEVWADDEFKAYLPNSQFMMYLVFDETIENTPSNRFLKSVCLAMFAQDYDKSTQF